MEDELLPLKKGWILEKRCNWGKGKYFSFYSIKEFGELMKPNIGNEIERANWVNSPSESPDREYCWEWNFPFLPSPSLPIPSLLFSSFPFPFFSPPPPSSYLKKKHFNYRNFLTNTKEERIIWWTSMCSSLSSSSYKHMVILISSIPLHSSPSPLSPAGLF